jgi:hypothetical protein
MCLLGFVNATEVLLQYLVCIFLSPVVFTHIYPLSHGLIESLGSAAWLWYSMVDKGSGRETVAGMR